MNRVQNRLGSSARGFRALLGGFGRPIRFRGSAAAAVALLSVLTLAGTGAIAQTFSGVVIDSNLLANYGAFLNCVSNPEDLQTHACEPWRAYIQAIRPPTAGDRAVVSAPAVLRLCRERDIKDVICGEAALLELRFHHDPCWKTNRC